MVNLVSVVVPLYNKREHIVSCLESVLAQTYSNLEVIIVNDGSTDGGDLIARTISDSRIYVIDQKNMGVSGARNIGSRNSRGRWIFFIDADDSWEMNHVEGLLDLAYRCKQASVIACPSQRIYANGKRSCVLLSNDDFIANTEYLKDYFSTFARLRQSPFTNSSFAVLRCEYFKIGGYKLGVALTEDADFWVRLALKAPIAMLKNPTARYNLEVSNNTRDKKQQQKFEVIKTLEVALNQKLVPNKYRAGVLKLLYFQKLVQVRRHIILGCRAWAWREMGDSRLWFYEPTGIFLAVMASLLPLRSIQFLQYIKNLLKC